MYGKRRGKASKTAESYTESYTPNQILHPILHPKSPVNTGHLRHGCRKCRLFFKNFFCGKRNNGDFILRMLGIIKASIASLSLNDNNAEDAKHRTSLRQKYGCFASKVRMFASKKSDVFRNPDYCSTPFTTVAEKLPSGLYHLPLYGRLSLKEPSKQLPSERV